MKELIFSKVADYRATTLLKLTFSTYGQMGLSAGGLICGGAYPWSLFCISKEVGLSAGGGLSARGGGLSVDIKKRLEGIYEQ